MWEASIVVAIGLTLLLVGRRIFGLWRRNQALGRLKEANVIRQTRGVRIAGLLTNAPAISGMNPRRRNIMTGDLALTPNRFVLVSNRGLLADVGIADGGVDAHGRLFTSVRCPGPGRLLIEGDIPLMGKPAGLFRFEISTKDAMEWAQALRPFVLQTDDSKHAAVKPPPGPAPG